jgi:hypothetical protein
MKVSSTNEDEAKTEVCAWNSTIGFSSIGGMCARNVLTRCLWAIVVYYLRTTRLNKSCVFVMIFLSQILSPPFNAISHSRGSAEYCLCILFCK